MNPVFYPYIKIGRLFSNGKDSTPPLAKSGVYLLSCRDCPTVYVGKTGRCFAARFCDHLSASAIAEHLIDNNHIPGNEEVLHVEKNFRLRTALEEIEMSKNTVREGRELVNRRIRLKGLVTSIFCTSPHYECTEL